MRDEQTQVMSPRPAVKYALLSSATYVIITWVLYSLEVVVPNALNFLIVLAAFFTGIVLTQLNLLRSADVAIGFERTWRYGNIAGFIIAFIITFYHVIVLVQTAGSSGILIFFGFSLMSKCLLSLVISAIVAFFISKI